MISKSIIEKWNKKIGLIENFSYCNPISIAIYKKEDVLNEGLIRTYPIEKTKEYLTTLYDFDESQVEIFNDNGKLSLKADIDSPDDINSQYLYTYKISK
jgi:hypothetical protein